MSNRSSRKVIDSPDSLSDEGSTYSNASSSSSSDDDIAAANTNVMMNAMKKKCE